MEVSPLMTDPTSFDPEVFKTSQGTPYLKQAGFALISRPSFDAMKFTTFVNSYGDTFDAADYENDFYTPEDDVHRPGLAISGGEALAKAAGQLCYLSFGEKRSRSVDAAKYIDNILNSKHGSVLEHANYAFVIWGIDRACSHELVRHRAGVAYSQMSQRYVDGKTLRFVEREEYQNDRPLHSLFEHHIDRCKNEYDVRAEQLMLKLQTPRGETPVPPATSAGMTNTERRKAVNSAARNCLPNETETAMVMTGNVRAWRHIIEMRASKFADSPIRNLAVKLHAALVEVAPHFFGDFEVKEGDGKTWLEPKHSKV
jgi:thymidylate synthase (FAD)